ncbi:MAG: nitrile hydratase subunit alpha [Acidimicrobiia bacterium]|nr:nitrile hydratase subunit alpha [Acidimicrobiia bacterium]
MDESHEHDHSDVPDELALRAQALQSLLVEKGIVAEASIDAVVEAYEHRIGPHLGAAVVARAWVEPDFKAALLEDGAAAVAAIVQGRVAHRLVVLENTDELHNLVVCTLCSCYPIGLLGLPPVWYKSAPYRSRAVLEPREVLAEVGTEVDDDVEVRVWDSNSEVRYLVLPQRPSGTEGWTEERLAELVGRNAMIGVERARGPEEATMS